MADSLPTVEMLREEYQMHFGETLPAEPADAAGGPVSLQRLKAPRATTGLALSGGGIRSATFSLGVLQALAGYRLLTSFDYLSTVSGGGYIGGWLTAWAHRHPSGIAGVMEDLLPRADRGHHEAQPIAHLRRYSNYLTPRVGLLSSDTWTIIGTYLRNLLVNWLALVPYFALLFLVPIVGVHALQAVAASTWMPSAIAGTGLTGGVILALASMLCLVVTMIVLGISLPTSSVTTADAGGHTAGDGGPVPDADGARVTDDGRRRRTLVARNQEEFLIKAVAPLVVGGIGLATAWFAQTKPSAATLALELPELFPWLGLSNWQLFALLGALAHAAAFSIYTGRGWWYTLTDSRRTLGLTGATVFVQPVAVLASGAFGGWVAWLAAGRILPALMDAAATTADPLRPIRVYVVLAVPLFLTGFVTSLNVYTALASRRTSEADREWFARASAWILAIAVGWVAVSGIALLGPALLVWAWGEASGWLVSVGGLSGLVSMWLGGSGHTKAKDDRAPKRLITIAAEWGLALAAPVFVALLAILLAAGLLALQAYLAGTWSISMLAAAGAIAAGCALVIGLVNWLINVNVFSLHGMYRDRLVRAYLGASRANRRPHKFTGFDQHDNVSVAHLAWPFFCAEEWPLLYAIAGALLEQPATLRARAIVTASDSKLLSDARAIEVWSESAGLAVVDRFNAVLIYSKEPARLRAEWAALLEQPAAAGEFSPHDWHHVRRIAAALQPSVIAAAPTGAPATLSAILAAAGEATWPRDVVNANVWSRAAAAALVARLNAVIASYAPAAALTGLDTGTAAHEEVLRSLSGTDVPASREDLCARLGALAPPVKPPFPIVNAAINLVSGEELAWQERQAASFTFTPLHAGSPTVGFRRMVADAQQKGCYGGLSGVSLGTAVTISGAAANPNMGYHSSPVITVLLTLFNARLGAWVGNPHDEKRFSHSYPRNQLIPMALTEALGLTHERGGYVHLSDGGHFENLGLYELVRRGCRYILLCDGGCDQEYAFEDLGNAVRKIRIDLGIEIDFEGFRVGPQRRRSGGETPAAEAGNYVAIGTIHYNRRAGNATRGELLYIKPAVLEKQEEPVDVWQYGRVNPAYPHEPTTDQWFSESQFESYRALGEYIMRSVADRARGQLGHAPDSVEALFAGVQQYLRTGAATAMTPAAPPPPPPAPSSDN